MGIVSQFPIPRKWGSEIFWKFIKKGGGGCWWADTLQGLVMYMGCGTFGGVIHKRIPIPRRAGGLAPAVPASRAPVSFRCPQEHDAKKDGSLRPPNSYG